MSIKDNKIVHLTKALRPLPDKFHSLVDQAERYRPQIMKEIHHFFDNRA
ncbi:hypothetical protein [Erysipelothrix urinaevulpis]|nr:hypothetical protein [Erysipelothrix urinaevulpis]